jgi:hypothetical protein
MLIERKVSVSGWVKDLASFATIVTIAAWQGWQARELIWGLWISSLVVGYGFILVTSLSPYFSGQVPTDAKVPKQMRELSAVGMNFFVTIAAFFFLGLSSRIPWIVLLVNAVFGAAAIFLARRAKNGPESVMGLVARRFFTYTPYVLFTLGFFTIHFGGFHFVHGMFLNAFFPIVEGTPFGESIGGTFAFVLGIVQTAARSYWPFVLITAWSRLGDMKNAIGPGREPNMFLPYVSVIKMHILIFVFAGLSAAGLEYWALYPVLLFYFFPTAQILKSITGKIGRRVARAPVK